MRILLDKTIGSNKLTGDMLANSVSLCVLFVSGLIINLLIGHQYGASGLGEFNLVYACYIILSQFSTFGIHYSVIRHISYKKYQIEELNNIFNSALLTVLIISITVSLVALNLSANIGRIFDIQPHSVVIISFANIFFALNKILLSTINALKKMKNYAFVQGSRYFFILFFVTLFIFTADTIHTLFYAFLITEIGLFCLMLITLSANRIKPSLTASTLWCKQHIHFGVRAFFAGIMVELNTRIDILILAFFLPKSAVGIYSFVAMLAEGLYQFVVVMKNIINPYLAEYFYSEEFTQLRNILKDMRKNTLLLMLLLSICVLVSYPILVRIMGQPEFLDGFQYLTIFIVGVIVSSLILPFDNIFNQCGKPTLQTFYSGIILFSNIALNIILVQLIGLKGAVWGTVIANYLLSSCLLYGLSMRLLQYNLWRFQYLR